MAPKRDGFERWKQEMLDIRMAVTLNRVVHPTKMTLHAVQRGDQRSIRLPDISFGLGHYSASIIEGEPAGARKDDNGSPYPYPTRKVRTVDCEGQPIDIVVALGKEKTVIIVTCMKPQPTHPKNRRKPAPAD